MTTLETSIFGPKGRGGLLDRFDSLVEKLDGLYKAALAAAISFAFGSISVVVTLIMTSHHAK